MNLKQVADTLTKYGYAAETTTTETGEGQLTVNIDGIDVSITESELSKEASSQEDAAAAALRIAGNFFETDFGAAPETITWKGSTWFLENLNIHVARTDWNQDIIDKSAVKRQIGNTDLSAYVAIEDNYLGEYGFGAITEEDLVVIGISKEDLLAAARYNMLKNIWIIPAGTDIEDAAKFNAVYLTNIREFRGISGLADDEVMKEICNIMRAEQLLIFPTSMHRVLIVPFYRELYSEKDILEINESAERESLIDTENAFSDHAYVWTGKELIGLEYEGNRQAEEAK